MNGTLKTQTVKRDYHIAVSHDGKLITTVQVRAATAREALQEAYRTVSGWQFQDKNFVE